MGVVNFGAPHEFVLALRDSLGFENFVETGTFHGYTAAWAAQHFRSVYTVERSETLYRRASGKLEEYANVTREWNDTEPFLSTKLEMVSPAIFWLDAHWSGGETAGIDDECPLLRELCVIAPTMDRNVLLIDDAGLFQHAPPPPHKPGQWPTVDQIIAAVSTRHPVWWCIFDDVIAIAPEAFRDEVKAAITTHRRTDPARSAAQLIAAVTTRKDPTIIFLTDPSEEVLAALLQMVPAATCHVLAAEANNGRSQRPSPAQVIFVSCKHQGNVPSVDDYCRTSRIGIVDVVVAGATHLPHGVFSVCEALLAAHRVGAVIARKSANTTHPGGLEATRLTRPKGYRVYSADDLVGLQNGPGISADADDIPWVVFAGQHILRLIAANTGYARMSQHAASHWSGVWRDLALPLRGVVQVGAHRGQELASFRELGARCVIMIEALPSVAAELQAACAEFSEVSVINCAVSNSEGEARFHVANNEMSSSLLELHEHKTIYTDIIETEEIAVKTCSLDQILAESGVEPATLNFLNIDVQGGELLVLKGAMKTLEHIELINLEVNFAELYRGCPEIEDIDAFLSESGFVRLSLSCDYHITWGDAVYARRSLLARAFPVDWVLDELSKHGIRPSRSLVVAPREVSLALWGRGLKQMWQIEGEASGEYGARLKCQKPECDPVFLDGVLTEAPRTPSRGNWRSRNYWFHVDR